MGATTLGHIALVVADTSAAVAVVASGANTTDDMRPRLGTWTTQRSSQGRAAPPGLPERISHQSETLRDKILVDQPALQRASISDLADDSSGRKWQLLALLTDAA